MKVKATHFGALISGDGFLQADNGVEPLDLRRRHPILIAQFTFAEGTYTGTSDFNAGGTDLTNAAFSVSNIPAPGALALPSGLAGLGRRRRG